MVLPLDGGWPLGIPNQVEKEHTHCRLVIMNKNDKTLCKKDGKPNLVTRLLRKKRWRHGNTTTRKRSRVKGTRIPCVGS